ncbi:MAG: hypothetical protein ACK8QZ_06010, partial [Anaerolineales bacterium]
DHRQIFDLLRQAINQDAMEHRSYLWAHIPSALEERLQELEKIAIQEKLEDRLLEELARNVIHLRRRILKESLGQLRSLQEDAEQEADELLNAYRRMVRDYAQLLRNLDMASHRLSMVK